MDYKRIYDSIIDKAQHRNKSSGYVERHHIIPRSLGGMDGNENLVELSAREHFICHLLLTKIYTDDVAHYKMVCAFLFMVVSKNRRYINGRIYERLKKIHSEETSKRMKVLQKGKLNSQYGTMWIYRPDTLENRKINKNEPIPEGWITGRKLKPDIFINCVLCGVEFVPSPNQKYCSKLCRNKVKAEGANTYGREQEFLKYYDETRSMNKSLQLMGLLGAQGTYYLWAKNVLNAAVP